MSIIIGKRNYSENFGSSLINQHSLSKLHVNKKIKLHEISSKCDLNIAATKTNIEVLKSLYPHISEQEISNVLYDCDDNVSIAKEILSKQSLNSLSLNEPLTNQRKDIIKDRQIRSIQSIKQKKPIIHEKSHDNQIQFDNSIGNQIESIMPESTMIMEFKSDNLVDNQGKILEEIEELNKSRIDINNLTDYLLTKIACMNNIDQIKLIIRDTLKEFQNEIEKMNEGNMKKLIEEKAILIKAFSKQREKNNAITNKNNELQTQLELTQNELSKLNVINYKLGLRLKSLNLSEEEKEYFQNY